MNNMKWVRIDTDLPYHDKLRRIRELNEGREMCLCWIWMILLCGGTGQGDLLMQTPYKSHTVETLAEWLEISAEQLERFLVVFEHEKMVRRDENGIHLRGWCERQNRDRRSKRYEVAEKEKEKEQEKQNEKEKVAQKEKVKRKEKAKEKAKETDNNECQGTHSFTHSITRERSEEGLDRKRTLIGGKVGKGLVMLSEEQIADLAERLSADEMEKYVSVVAECEAAGHVFRNRSHYQAILEMAERDRRLL